MSRRERPKKRDRIKYQLRHPRRARDTELRFAAAYPPSWYFVVCVVIMVIELRARFSLIVADFVFGLRAIVAVPWRCCIHYTCIKMAAVVAFANYSKLTNFGLLDWITAVQGAPAVTATLLTAPLHRGLFLIATTNAARLTFVCGLMTVARATDVDLDGE